MTGITTLAAGANVQNLGLGYDAVNDITNITDNLVSARSQTFNYDLDYRLTNAGAIYGSDKYSYDADGNRLTRTTGNVTETYHYSSAANMLQSTVKSNVTRSFGYTLNGNLNSDNRGTATNLVFAYDNRNRYSTLTIGGNLTATYKYNALGERLIKTVGGITTHYHYNQRGHLIAESQSSGAIIREYVWLDDMPLAQIESSGAVYYIHSDHLNRPQKMTDATKTVVWDNEQQPFGEPVSPTLEPLGYNTSKQFQMAVSGSPNVICVVQASTNLSGSNWVSLATNAGPFTFTDISTSNYRARFYRVIYTFNPAAVTQNLRFPGQYFDAESSLNYNMMRDYDSTTGRFNEADPIGIRGGVGLYGYTANNPIRNVDIYGLELTDEQIANILFNETRSFGGPELDQARYNAAQAIINGDNALGEGRPMSAPMTVTVPPQEQKAYQACMEAAIQAKTDNMNGIDPTQGAMHFNFRNNNSTSPFMGSYPISTSVGPLNNSFTGKGLNGSGIYANTYGGGQ